MYLCFKYYPTPISFPTAFMKMFHSHLSTLAFPYTDTIFKYKENILKPITKYFKVCVLKVRPVHSPGYPETYHVDHAGLLESPYFYYYGKLYCSFIKTIL